MAEWKILVLLLLHQHFLQEIGMLFRLLSGGWAPMAAVHGSCCPCWLSVVAIPGGCHWSLLSLVAAVLVAVHGGSLVTVAGDVPAGCPWWLLSLLLSLVGAVLVDVLVFVPGRCRWGCSCWLAVHCVVHVLSMDIPGGCPL